MSYIDVAIPGIIGIFLLICPQSMFLGSRAIPSPKIDYPLSLRASGRA
jgi:hypothetical protein